MAYPLLRVDVHVIQAYMSGIGKDLCRREREIREVRDDIDRIARLVDAVIEPFENLKDRGKIHSITKMFFGRWACLAQSLSGESSSSCIS